MVMKSFVAGLGAMSLLWAQGDRPSPHTDRSSALHEAAARHQIRFGTAINPAALANDADYRETAAREFNQIEPENAAKFGPIHPRQDAYNFGPVDALLDFAKEHNMVVRGATLVWHNQNPAWVTKGNLTPPPAFRNSSQPH